MRSPFKSPFAGRENLREKAYSTPEVMVVIGALGIVAAIGIGVVTGLMQSSKYNTAAANLEMLNSGVRQYAHAVKELPTNSTVDQVFTELKIDGSEDSRPGSPYLQSNLKVHSSSDSSTYRAKWSGYEFEMMAPGTGGTGLDLLKLQEQ